MDTETSQKQVASRLISLNEEFGSSFRPNVPAGRWLISSIDRNLRAYRLTGVDAWDILTEAYLRAEAFVERGGLIWNLVSWLKSASVLIIKEYQRKYARSDTNSIPEMDWFSDEHYLSPGENLEKAFKIEDLSFVLEAYLTSEERELLKWSVTKERSWKDIQQLLNSKNGKSPTIETLRQRKCRVLRKLQKAFRAIYAGFPPVPN